MPPVSTIVRAGDAGVSADLVRTMHRELARVGLPVADAGPASEVADGRFGSETQARIREFQERYRLSDTGDLDPTTGAVMALSASVASERDPARLRSIVRDARSTGPSSPDYDYWVGRYAVLAGDYELAALVTPRLVDLSGLHVHLDEVFVADWGPAPPRAPEVPFPENFYSYRYSVMAQADIEVLRTSAATSTTDRALRIAYRPANGSTDTFDPPHLPTIHPPPWPPFTGVPRSQLLVDSALAWLSAIECWQLGNAEFAKQRYASAVDAYNRCQQATLVYFATFPEYNIATTAQTLDERMDQLVAGMATNAVNWADLWRQITWRRQLLSLGELSEFDWAPIVPGHIIYQLLQGNLAGQDQPPPPTNPIGPAHRKMLMDARVLIIAAVLAPLARAEANRLRRQFAAARADFTRLLRNQLPVPLASPPRVVDTSLRCEFIETPFARLLLIETLLNEAEAQYKSRLSVDDEPDSPERTAKLARLEVLGQQFESRQIAGDPASATRPFQHLTAALTYGDAMDVMLADGEYVARVTQALDALHASVESGVASGNVESLGFRAVGQAVTVPTVVSARATLPGLSDGTHPHEPYLEFVPPPSSPAMRERNPRVYGLLLSAQSRLLQMWCGFNYLGYRDDYVPPWRFAYLLDRARYFAEHAKNAQRDYLNFLGNAENEENKEMSAAQTVELEKANVQIETARVEQSSREVAASLESAKLAQITAADAEDRAATYQDFADYADDLFETGSSDLIQDLSMAANVIPGVNAALTGVGDFFTMGFFSNRKQAYLAHAQRGLELHNLRLAAREAEQSRRVADAQLSVAKAGLVVAGLQRQAALFRHEFALQNLQFMRNRVLNSEQWYRLAGAIRSVAETYLRYAIELAFLAQQSYGFEADRRLDVIRFDYDLSDVGAMLAADFLLRDLDTLEQDLIVSQQSRQQQVRYVLSLAREFPDTLRTLAEDGVVSLSLRLEQLERHFPGLFNLRITSVEVQPVALMDAARVAIALTYLGAGMVRLKAQPGESALNVSDLPAGEDWLGAASADWPVKARVSGPETAMFSGLSRQVEATLGPIAANQRGAFEGVPGASNWRLDMSMRENQVVPDSLVDMIVVFTLAGYHDVQLRSAVDQTTARTLSGTSLISARRTLPDAYYSLVHTGRLSWDVSADMLSLSGRADRLRNLGVMLVPPLNGPEIGRAYCRYSVRLEVSPGSATVRSVLPEFTLVAAGLTLTGSYVGAATTNVAWDFGDDAPLAQGATVQHTYSHPGRYEVLVRLASGGRLTEYRCVVVVSSAHQVPPPLIVSPIFSAGAADGDGNVPVTATVPGAPTGVSLECSTGALRASSEAGAVELTLPPGIHIVTVMATRTLSARFYGRQRYEPTAPITMARGRVATNRNFDADGIETTTSPNALTTRLFGDTTVVSPVDRWTLELPLGENPWFTTVSAGDQAGFDGSELKDALLHLEFEQG